MFIKQTLLVLTLSVTLTSCVTVPKEIQLQGHTKYALSLPKDEAKLTIFSPTISGGTVYGLIPAAIDDAIKKTNLDRSMMYARAISALPYKVSLKEIFNDELLRQLKNLGLEVSIAPAPKLTTIGSKQVRTWDAHDIKEGFVIELYELHAFYFATTSASNFEPVVSVIYGTYDVKQEKYFPGTNFEIRSTDQEHSYSDARVIIDNPEQSIEGIRKTAVALAKVVAEKIKQAK